MKYGYYPGCSLQGISVEYDHSIRSLFRLLDVQMEELEDWICCGTLAAPSMGHMLGLATPLWNVAQARQAGFDQLITPCSACVYHFKNAAAQVAHNGRLRTTVEDILKLPLSDPTPAVHPLEILVTEPFEKHIKQMVRRDLSDLKVVNYYGCHISRPAEVMQFDDPENPQSMDRLLSWVGVQTMDWPGKVDCCGAHLSMIKPDIVVQMCTGIVESALAAGADAVVVACPMCHANLDTRQEEIRERLGRPFSLPILYFSQVIGYALGLAARELGMKKHIVDPVPLMLSKCRQRQMQAAPA
ncbi:MAG: CoB--CoM heterodisulfide reductase iron-sulfur subunit B family protein [Anaerolineae bacterium]